MKKKCSWPNIISYLYYLILYICLTQAVDLPLFLHELLYAAVLFLMHSDVKIGYCYHTVWRLLRDPLIKTNDESWHNSLFFFSECLVFRNSCMEKYVCKDCPNPFHIDKLSILDTYMCPIYFFRNIKSS